MQGLRLWREIEHTWRGCEMQKVSYFVGEVENRLLDWHSQITVIEANRRAKQTFEIGHSHLS
jgi:hypothetical protein